MAMERTKGTPVALVVLCVLGIGARVALRVARAEMRGPSISEQVRDLREQTAELEALQPVDPLIGVELRRSSVVTNEGTWLQSWSDIEDASLRSGIDATLRLGAFTRPETLSTAGDTTADYLRAIDASNADPLVITRCPEGIDTGSLFARCFASGRRCVVVTGDGRHDDAVAFVRGFEGESLEALARAINDRRFDHEAHVAVALPSDSNHLHIVRSR